MPATIPLLQEGRYTLEQEFPYVENCFLFQAYDTQKEAPVMIVEVPASPTKASGSGQSTAFAEQAERLVMFRHNSAVAVRSYFTEGGRNYLVMDPVEGLDLGSVIADPNRAITVAETAGWADNVLDALNAMHQSRPPIVFGSVRLENIFLRPDGSVALLASGMLYRGGHIPVTGTSSGSSPIAFSPLEQIWSGLDAASQKVIISKYDDASERTLKQDLDARSDLFSLGATLYKLVTGRTPTDALERSIEMIEGNPDPLVPPNKVDPKIPFEISDVIMKAMEIKREYRFDSAAIMRQVLKTALVRVKEREAEESLVKTVEGHDVSDVLKSAPAKPAAADTPKPDLQPARQAPVAVPPAQEAVAEARPVVAVPPARKTETFTLADLDDDLLGLLSPSQHNSEPPQAAAVESPKAAEAEVGSKLPVAVPAEPVSKADEAIQPGSFEPAFSDLPPEEVSPVETEPVEQLAAAELPTEDEEVHESSPIALNVQALDPESTSELEANVSVEEEVLLEKPEAAPAAQAAAPAVSSASVRTQAYAEQTARSGIGLPAIAAAAVVIVIAAVGGWFFLGSRSEPAPIAEPPAAAQPVQQDVAPAETSVRSAEPAQAEVPTQTVSEQPRTVEQPAAASPDQSGGAPSSASVVTPKAKKPAPAAAKTPAPKKAVTVDDLINDN